MQQTKKLTGLIRLCEELQWRVHLNEIDKKCLSLQFPCDLFLRSILMLFDLNHQGKSAEKEFEYLKGNLVAAYCQITNEELENVLEKYNL